MLFTGFRAYSYSQGIEESETLFVTPFGVEQGLRQSMVSHVIQDSNGLIWMTTGDGLHWFDGMEFRAFRVLVNEVYSHSDNLMRDIVEANPGTLTLSSSSSLLQFNTATGQFNIVYRKDGCYPVLLDPLIDQMPAAWFFDKKLCLVGKDRIIQQKLIFTNKNELPGNFYPKNNILYKSKELLISDNDGILILNLDKRIPGTSFMAKWVPIAGCQAISGDKTGRVFILVNGKISQYMGNGMMTTFFDTHIKDEMNLFIDSRDNFWLTGRNNNKQYKLSQGNLKEIRFCFHDGRHTDPIFPDIRSVNEDDHGNIWFGTDNDGVLLYSPGQVQLLRSNIGFTRCLVWFNNEIWAGTYNNGLWRISSDLSMAHRVNPVQDYKEVYYLDLAADRKGRLWIATRKGLEVIDNTGHSLFRHVLGCQKAKLMIQPGDTVTFFCDGKLYRYFSGDKIVFTGTKEFVTVSSILNTNDAWWIGNPFGLYRGVKNHGLDKNLLFVERNQLSSNAVYSLLLHDGDIWAATGNGIEIFDQDGKRKLLPAIMNELRNEVVYSLLSDKSGQVWFTGNHGLGFINVKKNHIVYLNTKNNLQSLEFNSNTACSSPDGKLYFGGIRGINGFDPSWFIQGKKDQKIRMSALTISDTTFTRGIPPGFAEINLSRQAPHISGMVFSSDFTNAGSRLFSFFLEGYQKDWGKPSQDDEFSYRDLPPGKYNLLVKCTDRLQNWSEPVTLLSVTIHPPLWKSAWFLIGSIILIIAATALLARKINSIRYNRRILALEQQNAVEKERLRISKDMHDEIGASLTRISILSELAKNQKEDRAEEMKVISQISDIAGGVVDEMSEIIWAMNPKNDTLDNFTSYFRQYASTYLETAGIDASFRLPEVVPSIIMSSELRRNVFLTIKEALHNIVKHSGARTVKVKMTLSENVIRITIMDDGAGFFIEKTDGWGNGLINMRRRMEESGGTFDIRSEIGKATTIQLSVILPVNNKSH